MHLPRSVAGYSRTRFLRQVNRSVRLTVWNEALHADAGCTLSDDDYSQTTNASHGALARPGRRQSVLQSGRSDVATDAVAHWLWVDYSASTRTLQMTPPGQTNSRSIDVPTTSPRQLDAVRHYPVLPLLRPVFSAGLPGLQPRPAGLPAVCLLLSARPVTDCTPAAA